MLRWISSSIISSDSSALLGCLLFSIPKPWKTLSHLSPSEPSWVISAGSGRARTRSRGWDAQVQSKGFQHCHALIGQEIEPTHCRTHRLLAWKGTVENQESERKGMNLMLSFTGLILVLFCGALHPNTYSSFLPSINNVQTVHQLLKVHPFWSILTCFFS